MIAFPKQFIIYIYLKLKSVINAKLKHLFPFNKRLNVYYFKQLKTGSFAYSYPPLLPNSHCTPLMKRNLLLFCWICNINPTSTFWSLQAIMKNTTNQSSFSPINVNLYAIPKYFFSMHISIFFFSFQRKKKKKSFYIFQHKTYSSTSLQLKKKSYFLANLIQPIFYYHIVPFFLICKWRKHIKQYSNWKTPRMLHINTQNLTSNLNETIIWLHSQVSTGVKNHFR